MSTKHTPALFAYREYVTDKKSFGFDADGVRIGETPNIAMDAGTPELARLVAAAPDLLKALELYISQEPGPDYRGPFIHPDEITRVARAAIAKARGEG